MPIYFYSSTDQYGCFSNFSAHPFFLDEQHWRSSEHYFQAHKFIGTAHFDRIRLAKTPKEAAELGRTREYPIRADWEEIKEEVMFKAVLAKFTTHSDIRQILIDTGTEEIFENARHDYYWGIGEDGSGKNRLGFILMEIRSQLQKRS